MDPLWLGLCSVEGVGAARLCPEELVSARRWAGEMSEEVPKEDVGQETAEEAPEKAEEAQSSNAEDQSAKEETEDGEEKKDDGEADDDDDGR